MEYEYRSRTIRMNEEQQYFAEVDCVIDFLKKNNISDIEMFYGWSWGEWETFDSNVNEIYNDIKKQEQKSGREFGGNDVYIELPELQTQILFCHEEDIHVEFNQVNKVVSDILNSWKAKDIVGWVRKNKVPIELEDIAL